MKQQKTIYQQLKECIESTGMGCGESNLRNKNTYKFQLSEYTGISQQKALKLIAAKDYVKFVELGTKWGMPYIKVVILT